MHFGKIKLQCDLNDLINDDYTLTKMIEYEKLLISLQKKNGEDDAENDRPSQVPIIAYTQGGYFGDSDLFAAILGLTTFAGRDMTATCTEDCSIFVMAKKELSKIQENFPVIYKEMEQFAIKRFQNH